MPYKDPAVKRAYDHAWWREHGCNYPRSERRRLTPHKTVPPEKRRIYRAVAKALETGALTKQPCEDCNNTKVIAHHDDYTKPLDVRWFCRSCHNIFHFRKD